MHLHVLLKKVKKPRNDNFQFLTAVSIKSNCGRKSANFELNFKLN